VTTTTSICPSLDLGRACRSRASCCRARPTGPSCRPMTASCTATTCATWTPRNWPNAAASADEGVAVTAMTFLSGEESLVVGSEDGSINAVYFRLQTGTRHHRRARTGARAHPRADARRHRRPVRGAAAEGIRRSMPRAMSGSITRPRIRCCSNWQRSGDVTTDQRDDLPALERRDAGQPGRRGRGLAICPAPSRGHAARALRRIWYEGYAQPTFVWQSTAGTDLAEPKYSLVPLIFGT
jgi:phosphate transport system permease protein